MYSPTLYGQIQSFSCDSFYMANRMGLDGTMLHCEMVFYLQSYYWWWKKTLFLGAAQSTSVLTNAWVRPTDWEIQPGVRTVCLRFKLCLWINTIYPLLQCQSSSSSVGKSIWLEFRGPRFESWLDLNFFLHHHYATLPGSMESYGERTQTCTFKNHTNLLTYLANWPLFTLKSGFQGAIKCQGSPFQGFAQVSSALKHNYVYCRLSINYMYVSGRIDNLPTLN